MTGYMRKIKLVIPKITHPSLNSWIHAHWAVKRKYKLDWDGEIMLALIEECGLTKLPRLIKKASITIKYYFRVERLKRDYDNYSPKFLMDGLVGRVIQDDNDKLVKVEWELRVDRKAPRTEIMVEKRK